MKSIKDLYDLKPEEKEYLNLCHKKKKKKKKYSWLKLLNKEVKNL